MRGRTARAARGEMRPEQDLVAAGYAGLEGSCRIAAEREEELSRWFSRRWVREHEREYPALAVPALDWVSLGASEWEEAGEGGICTALWNLSGSYTVGFSIDLREIPVRQGTVEICETYGLNPYRLLSGGLVILAADRGHRLCEDLAARGIRAQVIGRVTEAAARRVDAGGSCGFMERPREDEFLRWQRTFAREARNRK